MKIEPIETKELPTLRSGCSIFASREWHKVYHEGLRPFAILDSSNRIGTFCLFRGSKMGISYLITPPWAPHIGLDYELRSEKVVSQQSERKQIHQCIAEFLNEASERIVDITLSTDELDSQPYTWCGMEVKPRHTYHLDLNLDAEGLLAAMAPARRKNIRKAENDGLQVSVTDDADRFLRVVDRSLERQKISLDRSILHSIILSETLEPYRSLYLCSGLEGDLAAILVVHDKERAYYLIGGHVGEDGHEGANTLCLWQAMMDAKTRGQRIFDLEGSMVPSVERYYRGFGGKMKTFFQIRTADALGRLALKWRQR